MPNGPTPLDYQPSPPDARPHTSFAIFSLSMAGAPFLWIPFSIWFAWGYLWGDNPWPAVPLFFIAAAPALLGIAGGATSLFIDRGKVRSRGAILGIFAGLAWLVLSLVLALLFTGRF